MKKLLISLIILINLIVVPVFADDPLTVLESANGAVEHTSGALYGFGESFDAVYNYIVTENYITTNNKYILFPTSVEHEYDGIFNHIRIDFQLLVSSSNLYDDKFVVISLPRANYYNGRYDLWTGYTGQWSDITAYKFSYLYNYENLAQIGSITVTDNSTTVRSRWGNPWRTNFSFNDQDTIYLLVSDYQNVSQFGGLWYSVYSSQDILPTYLGEFVGAFNTGTWNDHYTINPNYVINVFRASAGNIANINTETYITSNSIIFDNGDSSDTQTFDYNINAIWGTLRKSVFNMLSGFQVVIQLFTIIFSWLPFEFTSLIYSALILAVTLLIIKVVRGG